MSFSISHDELKRLTEHIDCVFPTAVGVVDYRSGLSPIPHSTGFIVEITRSDVRRPISEEKNRAPSTIFPDEGEIPASEVRLVRSMLEGGYAD
jgi:hypothetical protein